MKRIGWLALVLSLSFFTGCGQSDETEPAAFDQLARWIPGDAEQVFFLDFEPDGEAGRHWERIRGQLEANPSSNTVLDSLLNEFRIDELGLTDALTGPAASSYQGSEGYNIALVNDETAARDALLHRFDDVTWQQEEYDGQTLTFGDNGRDRYEEVAWAIRDGFLFWTWSFGGDPLGRLKEMLDLAEEDSLMNVPSWPAVRARLPADPMGLVFINVAEQAKLQPPASGDTSPNALLGQQIDGLGFAAVPEQNGMRVEIAATFKPGSDKVPAIQEWLALPAIEPASWSAVPEDTALALFSHDASVIWPWILDLFAVDTSDLDMLSGTVGLDLEADLVGKDGPLSGAFVLAVAPPLPGQPISKGLPAAQLLLEARDTTQTQADALRAAMESRGATVSPNTVDGVALQTQVGTELTGYAISYGFDDDLFLIGSSPEIIGRGIAAQGDGRGLVETDAFQAISNGLPEEPAIAIYLHPQLFVDLVQANIASESDQTPEEWAALEEFESIGAGLRIQPDGLSGVLTFYMPE